MGEIETIFDNGPQEVANWIASNPDVNCELFINICGKIRKNYKPIIDDYFPAKFRSTDNHLYFYSSTDEVIHLLAIVLPSSSHGSPEELIAKWSEVSNYSLPTLFSSKNYVDLFIDTMFNMKYINTQLRDIKIDAITTN